MKILHIIPTLSKGGAERLVLDIIKQLNKKESTEARLVIFRNEINYDISQLNELISIIPSSVKLSLSKKLEVKTTDLQLFINKFKPDIIHTHLFEAELVSRFCDYPKAQWFSHVHDNLLQFKNWSWSPFIKVSITNWYEKQILFKQYKKNGGTHFIAISKYTETYIKSVQSKYPVTLLHNAIDVKRFQKPVGYNERLESVRLISVEGNNLPYGSRYIENIKSSNGGSSLVENQLSPKTTLSTEEDNKAPLNLNLINIGSFVAKKNQTFLLNIILELNKKGIQTSCHFLGEGPQKMEVENRAKELGVSNLCHFLGNVENVEKYLWQSDVYVHVATYEPLGLVLLEAMAAGLPVISLDGGGNRDIMINEKNGYLIEKQDPKEFAYRILQVYQNKEMSEFNSEFAKEFDIESYCDKLLTLITNRTELSQSAKH